MFSEEEDFDRLRFFLPIGRRFLESDEALTLREVLAGLLQSGKTFCKQKAPFPPSAADAKAFRARARPQHACGSCRRLQENGNR
jgi:hypothetical protein